MKLKLNPFFRAYKKEIAEASELLANLKQSELSSRQTFDEKGSIHFPSISQKEPGQEITFKQAFILKAQPSIMFTRLDAVQNRKRLLGAVSRGHINDQTLQVEIFFSPNKKNSLKPKIKI